MLVQNSRIVRENFGKANNTRIDLPTYQIQIIRESYYYDTDYRIKTVIDMLRALHEVNTALLKPLPQTWYK